MEYVLTGIGLEIKVSFTKSKGHLKNLSSLSGGQKATISLIFILAIQVEIFYISTWPSFCLR